MSLDYNYVDLDKKEISIILKSIDLPAFIHERGIIKNLNHNFMELIEAKTKKDIIGKSLTAFIHPDQVFETKKLVEKVSEPNYFIGFSNMQLVSFSGRDIYAEYIASPLPFDKLLRIVIFIDRSEHKKTKLRLKQAEDRFRSIAELLPIIICDIDLELNLTYINSQGLRELGKLTSKKGKINILDIIHQTDLQRAITNTKKVIQRNYIGPQEYKMVNEKGDIKYYSVSSSPILKKSKVIGFRACLTDISRIKLAEQERRISDEKYSNLINSISDLFFVVDKHGFIEYVSHHSTIFGIKPEDAIGKNFIDFIEEEDRPYAIYAFQEAITTGKIRVIEFRIKDKYGNIRWFEDIGSLNWDEFGNVKGVSGLLRDITEQKAFEKKIINAQKMDSIGSLSVGIAHDFNNMISGILGFSNVLLNKVKTSEEKSMLYEVLNICNRASSLAKKMLSFGRSESFLENRVNINILVKEVVGILEHTSKRDIDIITYLSNNLNFIKGDSTQINQLVLNICVNAKEAMPEGGILTIKTQNVKKRELMIKCKHHTEDFVLLEVEDTGTGISNDIKEKIFEPFFTTKKGERVKGTGLGLSTSQAIIKNHKGFMELESEKNKGTSFRIYFPVYLGKDSNKKNIKKLAQNQKILLIDNEKAILNATSIILESLGYSVIVESDAEKAFDFYKLNYLEISLIILDLEMSKISGQDLFYKFKTINPKAAITITTGLGTTKESKELIRSGALSILNKPYDFIELSNLLEKHFKKSDE